MCASHYFTIKHHSTYGIMQWYTTYTRIIKSPARSKDECFYNIKPDVSINVPFYAIGYAHNPKENRKDKVYSPLSYKCRFIGYAIDVNWTNTPLISKANESNFVNYKDSYIILMNDTRYIRHDAIFELYQNQPTILNPSDPKQDSNYTNEEYLEEFDRTHARF